MVKPVRAIRRRRGGHGRDGQPLVIEATAVGADTQFADGPPRGASERRRRVPSACRPAGVFVPVVFVIAGLAGAAWRSSAAQAQIAHSGHARGVGDRACAWARDTYRHDGCFPDGGAAGSLRGTGHWRPSRHRHRGVQQDRHVDGWAAGGEHRQWQVQAPASEIAECSPPLSNPGFRACDGGHRYPLRQVQSVCRRRGLRWQ